MRGVTPPMVTSKPAGSRGGRLLRAARALFPRLLLGLALVATGTSGAGPRALGPGETRVEEDFSRDPGWEGRNNVPPASAAVTRTQAFGFSPTRHVGAEPGEIGGSVWRSLRPAWYARRIPPRTLEEPLRASGKLCVTRSDGQSGVLVGWFHHSSRGWRTPNSLVFRIDGEEGRFRVFFEYGTQTWATGGGATFEGPYQTTTTPMPRADGTPHTWSLAYDPAGAGGRGEMTFVFDGAVFTAALAPGHKEEGARFDRFGIMNLQLSGNSLALWLDDLTIDGDAEDFSRDPGWEGMGNRTTFRDAARRPYHDFGYRSTAHAGGRPGEVGGLMWRIESILPEHAGYYGTAAGPLSLDDALEAGGKVSLQAAAADSAILLGWFNSHTPIGAPPENFLGILVEGPSRVGHYFRPACGTSDDQRAVLDQGPVIRPDGRPHPWTFRYAPEPGRRGGRVTVSLDGREVSMDLDENARKGNAAFDRFGFLSWHRGGHFVEIYFDDLSYTARRPERRAGGR